ncbi:MAG TPA: histidinol-phosphate transaminase [Gammaproteobacteria bacterium]|nr:histidinol-phosphate transaminase [Gammaproteobacteria bacterium]
MNRFEDQAVPGVRRLQPYQPGKPIEELERELGITNIIKLASNENPLGPGAKAKAAVTAASAELARYPDGNGFALKQRLAARHGVDMVQITLGNGSSDPLEFVVRALVQPGDEVIFSQHAFAMYPIVTRAAGGSAVVTPARDWGHDLDAMRAAITARTRVIFIANPNNPTGTWLDGEALRAFIAAVPEHVVVVVDEAYFEYASAPAMALDGYPDASRWLADFPNLMVTRTFSKAWGLAGLRVGYGLSHPDLADLMNRIRPPFNVNSVALAAAEAALDDVDHLAESIAVNVAGLRQLTTGLAALGLDVIPSAGNFLSVRVGEKAMPVYERLLRAGIIVRPVENYDMPGYVRITVGLEEENQRCLDTLASILA